MSRSLIDKLVHPLTLLVGLILCRLHDKLLLSLSRSLDLIVHSLWLEYLPSCLIGFISFGYLSVVVAFLHLSLNLGVIVIVAFIVLLSPLPIRVLVRLRLVIFSAVSVHLRLCHLQLSSMTRDVLHAACFPRSRLAHAVVKHAVVTRFSCILML